MNRIILYLIILSICISGVIQAQNNTEIRRIEVPPPICYGSGTVEKSFVPPPSDLLLKSDDEKKSDIVVSYSLFPANAKEAFEYAVTIWEHIIDSDIPINVQANWRSQGTNTLGSAGPTGYYSNFENTPHKDRFYPVVVAERITKSEINPIGFADITSTFNKDVNWYFGTDGDTPSEKYDFVTVALHEIGHGLGFTGFFFTISRQGAYGNDTAGDVAAFDLMVMNKEDEFLVDTDHFESPSSELYQEFISNALYANSPSAQAITRGETPRLYAPQIYNDGSSIYHLNDATYPNSSINSLMTHAIGKGEAVHDPGPITRGLMADIGWKHMYLDLDKPKDMEVKKPIVFNLSIESDYALKTNSVVVYYSFDSFTNKKNTLQLLQTGDTNLFSAVLIPEIETGEIQYYVSAKDTIGRIFSLPTEAPNEFYTITIGPDTISPVITHNPIPYFVLKGNPIPISTNADDNLGVDTVYVEYFINNIEQPAFGLNYSSGTLYENTFNLDLENLNDGDSISYYIVAIDSSIAKNSSSLPEEEKFSFRIEKIFDPIGSYYATFNTLTSDFLISDFEVYTASGFVNGSLHSPHPYPSPNKDNTEWQFSTLLKHPIILTENATMSFDEVVLVEPGEVLSKFGDDDFWDYVIVEGSLDTGKTWKPFIDGYDSGDQKVWKDNFNANMEDQESKTVGIPDWYIKREIDLLETGDFKVGDTVLFQFRLFSDPYANGWGWTIDNLRIQQPVSAPVIVLSPGNIMVYPNPFNSVVNVSIYAKNNIDRISLDVFNSFGQKIYTFQESNIVGELKHEIDLSPFSAGMYFIKVSENEKMIYTNKMIKN